MIYLVIVFVLIVNYYTLTYGVNVWKNEKNTMGGFAVIFLAILSTAASIIFLAIRR
jgi:hypothetical protein